MTDNILKYKTRGTSRPDGKAKVFLCCHTGDFERYFMLISDDILEFQNCSIWYMESASMSLDSDMMFDLSQMQLFVIPVTYQFLTDDTNPAIEIFQFALQQNIPILPIMVETNLVHFYEKRFGKIQFLDRVNNDPTVIPYLVKLSQYLAQVLGSDDMTEKIRSAFQTYIFLSYRKKDRQYAQKVMKKIHENARYERAAIWYDEFLVPGEQFNEEIGKALEKSCLFSMVVTPNIVNEENYVMNVEYPMARELDKTILPIEIVPTDRTLLQKCYFNLPEPVEFSDDSSLQDRLRMAIPEATDTTGDNGNRDFFIGLAYLSGIDVELDRGKGIGLIERAAETGLEEAIRKLVAIYSKGIGLARDFEKAYAWEKRLIEKYMAIAEQSGKDEDSMVYLRELMNFIYLTEEGGDAGRGISLCEEAYELSLKICSGKGKTIARIIQYILKRKWNGQYFDEAMYYLLKSCRLALRFSRDMDIRKMVEKWLDRVMFLTKFYEKIYNDESVLKELWAVYNDLTDIAIWNMKYDRAESFLEKMSIILTDIFETQEDSADFKFYQALICQREEELNQALGNWAQVHTVLQTSVDLLMEIADEYPEDTETVTRLIEGQNRQGILYCREQDKENAEKCLSAVQKRIEDLKDRGYTFVNGPLYAQTRVLEGDILLLKGDNENALAAYSAAYGILSAIIKNNLSASVYRDLSEVLLQMGDCCERLGKYEEAAKKYDESKATINAVFCFSKSIIDARLQADACERLWRNAINRKDALLEREWYEKLLFIRTEIDKKGGSESDNVKLNDLIRTRKSLKEEGRIGSIDYENPFCLAKYIMKNPIEYDEKVQLNIDMEIGRLVDQYWQTICMYMDDKTAMAFTKLTLILTRTGGYSDSAKADEVRDEKLYYGSIVLKFLLEQSNAFIKYDECAALILNYCGYYAIDGSKHMLGGKKQKMEDFWNYYGGEPFWLMPIQRIQYMDLWRAMHYWIMETKHKYL